MWGQLIWLVVAQVVVFVAMLYGLKRVLLRDTLNAVHRLRDAEAELGKKEDAVRRKIEENESEVRRKAAEAQEVIARTKEAADKELTRMRESLLEESKKERDRLMAEAVRGKDKMRQELVHELDAKAMDYAGHVYELVFSDKIGDALNRVFLDELLGALEEVDGSSITVEATQTEVECSHPLDAQQKERLKDIVARKFNLQLPIVEKVTPGLIVGVKIKLGSLEIDGSLLNRFREAVEELKKSRA